MMCFTSPAMQAEYRRYGLAGFRTVVGTLQLLGAAGLLVGFREPWIGQASAGGLALLMLLGVGVRIRIRDTPLQALPAFAYLVLNGYLCLSAF